MIETFDLKFEDILIKKESNKIYEEFISHAYRRQLEPEYVVKKFIKELQAIARESGYIK